MKKIASIGDLAPAIRTEVSLEQQVSEARQVEEQMTRASFTMLPSHIRFLTKESARLTVERGRKVSSSELIRELIDTYVEVQGRGA